MKLQFDGETDVQLLIDLRTESLKIDLEYFGQYFTEEITDLFEQIRK